MEKVSQVSHIMSKTSAKILEGSREVVKTKIWDTHTWKFKETLKKHHSPKPTPSSAISALHGHGRVKSNCTENTARLSCHGKNCYQNAGQVLMAPSRILVVRLANFGAEVE